MTITLQAPSNGGPFTINGAAGQVWRVDAGGIVEVDPATAKALASRGFLAVAGFAIGVDDSRTPLLYPSTAELP